MAGKFAEASDKFMGLMEKGMCHHKGKFVAGSKITIADFVAAAFACNMIKNPLCPVKDPLNAALAKYPMFKAYVECVETKIPYLKTREAIKTPF